MPTEPRNQKQHFVTKIIKRKSKFKKSVNETVATVQLRFIAKEADQA